jgi:signal transduction histidine kinase
MSMTSLPIPLSESAATGLALPHLAPTGLAPTNEDEQFLLRAFRSFSCAAAALEGSYANLRAEVERLRRELEKSNRDLASSLEREQAQAELSAVLAHEMRNPLASLELFAGLLAESDLPAECHACVEHMQAGLRTLAATVNNVLHFYSRPEPARAPLDLGELLHWAHEFLRPLAGQAGITLSLENQLAGIALPADRHRLEQVLLNLVLNAVRAVPAGGWIELRGHTVRTKEGGFVKLMVADNGLGISPENLSRIFEPGFSTHADSSGLGLAVCRKIVEQHAGVISVASRPGRGARFTLTFPMSVACTGEAPEVMA